MAQAYRTTYSINYRWFGIKDNTLSLKQKDIFAETPPPGDYWLDISDDINKEWDHEVLERIYKKRSQTTYDRDYCKKRKYKLQEDDGEETENNALLEYGTELYKHKKNKILPPLPTARRIHGFLSPKRMYTPLTTYQSNIGRLGYNILKRNDKSFNDIDKVIGEDNKENIPPTKQSNKNYTVSINGQSLTIEKSYDNSQKKFTCTCK